MNKGIIYTALSYLIWGFLPIYWRQVQDIPSLQILCHRMVWAVVFNLIILAIQKHFSWIKTLLKSPKTLLTFLATAVILALNWGVFIWAVNNGYIVDASLGYFINPLFYVLLGVVFLREKVRKGQAVAIAIAAIGVFYLTFMYGSFPWIGLTLALTFGTYGLLRKTAALSSVEGQFLETSFMLIPAGIFLIFQEIKGVGSFGHVSMYENILLIAAGAVTAIPLLLFAKGAREISLTSVGILQYIAPTGQFLVGVLIYGEVFSRTRMIGFSFIWIALIIYTIEMVWVEKRKRLL